MKTDDLLNLMVASQRPVDGATISRATTLGAGLAIALTLALVVATLGARADLAAPAAMWVTLGKAALGGAVAAGALAAFTRSLRPGARASRTGAVIVAAAALVVAASALVTLAQAPSTSWPGLIFGRNWLACLVAVPLYALAPFALMARVARKGAPVDLRKSGFLAGLASGGLAVVGYSVHCPEDAAPFIATWYPLALAATAAFGALALPRLARW